MFCTCLGHPPPPPSGVCPLDQTSPWCSKALPEGPVYNCSLFSAAFLFPSPSYSFSIYTPFSHACHLLKKPHENSDCVSFIFCCFPKIQPGSSTGKAPHKCLLNAWRASRSGCGGPRVVAGYQMQTVTQVPGRWMLPALTQEWADGPHRPGRAVDQGPPWLWHHKGP